MALTSGDALPILVALKKIQAQVEIIKIQADLTKAEIDKILKEIAD